VVAQVGLSVVLLAAAGLMGRTFERLRSVEPGFDPSGVLVAELALPFNAYTKYDQTTGFYRSLVQQVEQLPAVASAAVGSDLPIAASDGCSLFDYPGRPDNVSTSCIRNAVIGPGYFTTLGVTLTGRDLEWSDLDSKTGAVVLSDALGRRLFEDDPLDKAVNGPNDRTRPPYRVAGVTRQLVWERLDQPPTEIAFFPLEPIPGTWLWFPPARMRLLVKVSRGDPVSVVPAIREIVRSLDPEVALEEPRTMEQVVAGSLLRVRLVMLLLAVSAVAALILSVVGLYGVVAYSVARRTREIGVRIAVGAPAGRVRAEILRQSLRMTGAGLVIGLAGSVLLGRLMQSLLYGVSATDPVTLVAVAALLLAVTVGASIGPATRAAAIDPVAALREE
jgi:predicted permease